MNLIENKKSLSLFNMTTPIAVLLCLLLALINETGTGKGVISKSIDFIANSVIVIMNSNIENGSSLSNKLTNFTSSVLNKNSIPDEINKLPTKKDYDSIALEDVIKDLTIIKESFGEVFMKQDRAIKWKFNKGNTFSQGLRLSLESQTRWRLLWRLDSDYRIFFDASEYESIVSMAIMTKNLLNNETGGRLTPYICDKIGVLVITTESLNFDGCIAIQ